MGYGKKVKYLEVILSCLDLTEVSVIIPKVFLFCFSFLSFVLFFFLFMTIFNLSLLYFNHFILFLITGYKCRGNTESYGNSQPNPWPWHQRRRYQWSRPGRGRQFSVIWLQDCKHLIIILLLQILIVVFKYFILCNQDVNLFHIDET